MSDFDKYGDFFEKYTPKPSDENKKSYIKMTNRAPRKYRKNQFLKVLIVALPFILIIALVIGIAVGINSCSTEENGGYTNLSNNSVVEAAGDTDNIKFSLPIKKDYTINLSSQIDSQNAILVDCSDNTILAQKSPDKKIYPASMTKVMTLLVASENIDSIDGQFQMTSKIIDPLYLDGPTMAGFCPGETVKIEDMFYGMILESGAEASVGLAEYISGSEEEFVKLMNKKVTDLGLKNTHFTNVTGLHNDSHYTTCSEMAVIMKAALENDFCKKVLSTEYYNVAPNSHHEELKFHSTMFSRMYGTEPGVATILGGKTGYTVTSGNCLVSYGVTDDGRNIICVTADGGGKYKPIYDCIMLYKTYTHPSK